MSTDGVRFLQQENVRLRDENHKLKEELSRLHKAIHALSDLMHSIAVITPETDVITLVRRLLGLALNAVDSENGSFMLLDEESGELAFVEVFGEHREQLVGMRLPAGEGVAGWVVKHRAPKLVPDTRQEPQFSPLVDQATGYRSSTLLCAPLLDDRRPLGALEIVNKRSGEPFDTQDLEILLLAAYLASMALVRAERVAS
jgi:GAF domain-containing protein